MPNNTPSKEIICCDVNPASRATTVTLLKEAGYSILATGNPQVASALVQGQPFEALILCVGSFTLPYMTVVADARRSKPNIPILVVFNEQAPDRVSTTIPCGLVDLVLVRPQADLLKESVRALLEPRQALATAG